MVEPAVEVERCEGGEGGGEEVGEGCLGGLDGGGVRGEGMGGGGKVEEGREGGCVRECRGRSARKDGGRWSRDGGL